EGRALGRGEDAGGAGGRPAVGRKAQAVGQGAVPPLGMAVAAGLPARLVGEARLRRYFPATATAISASRRRVSASKAGFDVAGKERRYVAWLVKGSSRRVSPSISW